MLEKVDIPVDVMLPVISPVNAPVNVGETIAPAYRVSAPNVHRSLVSSHNNCTFVSVPRSISIPPFSVGVPVTF